LTEYYVHMNDQVATESQFALHLTSITIRAHAAVSRV